MLCVTYVASFLSSISIQHLTESEDVPKIITSMVRYHLYYQIRRFMKTPSLLDRYASHFEKMVKKYLPIKHISNPSVGTDRDGNYFISKGTVNFSTTDYIKSYCAKHYRNNQDWSKTSSTINRKLRVRGSGRTG